MFAIAIITSSSAQPRNRLLKEFDGCIQKNEKEYILAVVYGHSLLFSMNPITDQVISTTIVFYDESTTKGSIAACEKYLIDRGYQEYKNHRVWINGRIESIVAYILYDMVHKVWYISIYYTG